MSENNFIDPFAFMKDIWGSLSSAIPGMIAPTLDINEIDKKISDLKAVEGWLNVNLSMLNSSIQGLELQKSALHALNAMQTGKAIVSNQIGELINPAKSEVVNKAENKEAGSKTASKTVDASTKAATAGAKKSPKKKIVTS